MNARFTPVLVFILAAPSACGSEGLHGTGGEMELISAPEPEEEDEQGAAEARPWGEAVVMDPSGNPTERISFGATERLGRIAPPDDESLKISGVDLGVGFTARGGLHFLFGDVKSSPGLHDRDPVASLPAAAGPEDMSLIWHCDETGAFEPLGFTTPVPTHGMAGPVDGLEIGEQTYVFYATDFDPDALRHSTSVLAHTREPLNFGELEVDHAVRSEHFINISAALDGDVVWLFGSGAYRASRVYLARATRETLSDRRAWQYFAAAGDGALAFAPDELQAAPLIDSECVGELSVRRDPRRELYLMTYNCLEPRGIHLRVAKAPWGPWSAPVVIMDPLREGYGVFIHRAVCTPEVAGCWEEDDGLSDPGREREWGGEYGPYMIEPWIESDRDLLTIYYTLSSWNPYAVHLMRTTLVRSKASEKGHG